jgi:Protein tyrosine and serine/threonine kinase/Leucine rich repeat
MTVDSLSMDTLTSLRAGHLKGITRLDLKADLTEFPREIFDLADSLEVLNLSDNQLSELPADLSRLKKLKVLLCLDNRFDHLPVVLATCSGLEMISFKANQIETVTGPALPERLRWLVLTDNKLRHLPAEIGRCSRLQKLMLAGNQLEHLPAEMANCINLELIRLAANRFEELPPWLFELPRLAWLGLGGNPWSDTNPLEFQDIPSMPWEDLQVGEILGQGASGIIYQARGKIADDPVAVKIFKGEMTSDGLPASEMAISVAAGKHPNLIEVLAKVTEHPEQKAGLVMGLVGTGYTNLGGPPSLDSCTRDIYSAERRFSLADVFQISLGMASVAVHLHSRNLMHGDFYAHNCLWDPQGHCLLGDFGAGFPYPNDVGLEQIEVRAFGCLLEELLVRGEFQPNEASVMDGLWDLQRRCSAEVVRTRPRFAEVQAELKRLHLE